MRFSLLVYRTVRCVRSEGIAETSRRIVRHLFPKSQHDLFDVVHKTDTAGEHRLWQLDVNSPNVWFAKGYQPVQEQDLRAALEFLGENWGTFSFVDLGCGKGRALIIAGQLGFSRVIGVEFAASLVETAKKNVTITKCNAEVFCEDAASFEFPRGNLVVFLYNPFGEEIMRPVIENLRKHSGGKLYLLYERAECMALVDSQADFLAKMGKAPGTLDLFVWQRTI